MSLDRKTRKIFSNFHQKTMSITVETINRILVNFVVDSTEADNLTHLFWGTLIHLSATKFPNILSFDQKILCHCRTKTFSHPRLDKVHRCPPISVFLESNPPHPSTQDLLLVVSEVEPEKRMKCAVSATCKWQLRPSWCHTHNTQHWRNLYENINNRAGEKNCHNLEGVKGMSHQTYSDSCHSPREDIFRCSWKKCFWCLHGCHCLTMIRVVRSLSIVIHDQIEKEDNEQDLPEETSSVFLSPNYF